MVFPKENHPFPYSYKMQNSRLVSPLAAPFVPHGLPAAPLHVRFAGACAPAPAECKSAPAGGKARTGAAERGGIGEEKVDVGRKGSAPGGNSRRREERVDAGIHAYGCASLTRENRISAGESAAVTHSERMAHMGGKGDTGVRGKEVRLHVEKEPQVRAGKRIHAGKEARVLTRQRATGARGL